MSKIVVAKKLTTKKRKSLPSSSFVFPKERAYPIHDFKHAKAALQRVSQHGTPAEKSRVRAAVKKRYPSMEVTDSKKTTVKAKKKSELFNLITKTANSLDKMGLYSEADVLDGIAKIMIYATDPGIPAAGATPVATSRGNIPATNTSDSTNTATNSTTPENTDEPENPNAPKECAEEGCMTMVNPPETKCPTHKAEAEAEAEANTNQQATQQ